MDWTMKAPCGECPFRRPGTGGNPVRLTSDRVEEIAGMMLDDQGGMFPCHKTVVRSEDEADDDDDDDGLDCRDSGQRIPGPSEVHCAGALIFAEKNETATQMMRIAARLGCYDPRAFTDAAKAAVFDDIEEMLETAFD